MRLTPLLSVPFLWLSAAACVDPAALPAEGEGEAEAAPALGGAVQAATDPLLEQLQAIPGLTVVAELPVPASYPAGTRFFSLTLTQRANHLSPWSQEFEQRATLLVRDPGAPTVLYSTGYNLPIFPFRAELTRLLDNANQLAIEHRFFPPSRPEPANWRHLTILQAAFDHHRFVEAFRPLLTGRWISTGASKGGMTSVYHRRFFPDDVHATVAYVAPQDVIDRVDRYIEFIDNVGPDPACRQALERVQREALARRDEIVPLVVERGAALGYTFGQVLEADQAFEYQILETPFTFWQYGAAADCADIPGPGASVEDLYAFLDATIGLSYFSDEDNYFYAPYWFAAATQLNYPEVKTSHLADLLRYLPEYGPRSFVPPEVEVPAQQPLAMLDIDLWVRLGGKRLMFVYGEYDPWSAESFHLGPGTTDSFKYTVPAGNHGASIAQLPEAQRLEAAAAVRRWGNLPPLAASFAGPAGADLAAADDEEAPVRLRRRGAPR